MKPDVFSTGYHATDTRHIPCEVEGCDNVARQTSYLHDPDARETLSSAEICRECAWRLSEKIRALLLEKAAPSAGLLETAAA